MKASIEKLAAALGRDVADAAGLAAFVELVRDWNARVNLTAARTPEAMVEVMCADALVLASEALVPPDGRVVDVGSGAGGPALALAILRPDLRLTLVEPLRKRVTFLRTAVGTLGLADRVKVLEGRLELDDPGLEGAPFDLAMSRATFAPAEWLAAGTALAPRVLVLTAQEEPPEAPKGFRVGAREAYRLPSSGARRQATLYARA